MTIDQVLEHLFGENFDPKHRLIDWTRKAIRDGDIKVFDAANVKAVTLRKFKVDRRTFSGTFTVAINGVDLPDAFSCSLNGAGWLDFYVPGYEGPLGTQGSVPCYLLPDEVSYTISKLLRRVFPRLKPLGIDRSTGNFIDAHASIHDRGGSDWSISHAFMKARRSDFMCSDYAPFYTDQKVIVQALWNELSRDNRVCLMPQYWNKLYHMLPNRSEVNGRWTPPVPLILAAWDSYSADKKARMHVHIEWAIQHGAAEAVFDCLKAKRDHWLTDPYFESDFDSEG